MGNTNGAQKLATELRRAFGRRRPRPPEGDAHPRYPTFATYAERYLAIAEQTLKPSTAIDYPATCGALTQPSSQLGVIHGNDARLYQIRVAGSEVLYSRRWQRPSSLTRIVLIGRGATVRRTSREAVYSTGVRTHDFQN